MFNIIVTHRNDLTRELLLHNNLRSELQRTLPVLQCLTH